MIENIPAHSRRNALAALAIMVALIFCGSAYPFHFALLRGSDSAFQYLLATLNTPADSSDVMVNIIVYLPLGFFAARLFRIDLGPAGTVALTCLIGAFLATACEVTQFYVPERVPSVSDIFANTTGTVVGAVFAVLSEPRSYPAWEGFRDQPFPMLLVASWLLYRLYPFVPVIGLHAYEQSLSPLYDTQYSAYDFIRFGATWLAIAATAEAIAGPQKALRLYFLLALFVFMARLVVAARMMRPDEFCGIAIGYVLWTWLLKVDLRRRALLAVLPLYLFVLFWRLQPFQFQAPSRPLSLELFSSFMNGSTEVNLQNFLVKVFYYGTLVYLTSEAGLRLWIATALVAAFLLFTSALELYLPFRSAEGTDAAIAIVIGILIGIVNGGTSAPHSRKPPVAANQIRAPGDSKPRTA